MKQWPAAPRYVLPPPLQTKFALHPKRPSSGIVISNADPGPMFRAASGVTTSGGIVTVLSTSFVRSILAGTSWRLDSSAGAGAATRRHRTAAAVTAARSCIRITPSFSLRGERCETPRSCGGPLDSRPRRRARGGLPDQDIRRIRPVTPGLSYFGTQPGSSRAVARANHRGGSSLRRVRFKLGCNRALHTRARERQVRDSAGRGGGLDLILPLEPLQSVPEAYASAEQDRDDDDVHVVDEPGGNEVADHGRTSAEAYVLAPRSLAGSLERLGRRGVDEVVCRAP